MEKLEYLEIKNWAKYQADKDGHIMDGPSPWIKDWTNKEADYEYSKLTYFQRYLYDALRRLRGRFGKNPPNDPDFIARATLTLPRDHAHITHAIRTLVNFSMVRIVDTPFSDAPPQASARETTTSPIRVDKSREETEIDRRTGHTSPSEKKSQTGQNDEYLDFSQEVKD